MLRLIAAIAFLTAGSALAEEISFVERSPTNAIAVAAPSPPALDAAPQVQAVQASTCDDLSFCCPTWFASADALWLQRAGEPLVQGLTNTGGIVDQAFPSDQFEPGVRLTVGRHLDCCCSVEALYFGQQFWSTDRTVRGDPVGQTVLLYSPNLIIDDIIGGFDTLIAYSYRARLHNFELNRRHDDWNNDLWSRSTLIGFRYFQFDERLQMNAFDGTFGSFENLQAAGSNQLFGAQIGRRWLRDDGLWRASIEGKAGIYGNSARKHVFHEGDAFTGAGPSGVLENTDSKRFVAAGIFDLTFGLSRQITDRLSVQVGYQMYCIAGLALAPGNLGDNDGYSDVLFLHGFSSGVAYAW